MFCDFHTHNAKPAEQVVKLLSAAELPAEPLPGVFFALELHPWELPETFSGLSHAFLDQIHKADAIGEVGLDRLKGPTLDVQRLYLRAVLEAAADCRKPVVFHCVRAFPELLAAEAVMSFLTTITMNAPKPVHRAGSCEWQMSTECAC